jgi:hypothetical protein
MISVAIELCSYSCFFPTWELAVCFVTIIGICLNRLAKPHRKLLFLIIPQLWASNEDSIVVTRYIEGVAIQYIGVYTEVLDEIDIERFVCELLVFFSFVAIDGLSFYSSSIS